MDKSLNGKTILQRRKKYKHYSKQTINTICNSDLQQLLYWYDISILDYRNNLFYLSSDDKIVIYPNMGYDHYSGKTYTPLQLLTDVLQLSYPDALFLLNYFYYKIPKQPIKTELDNWSCLSFSGRCATGRNPSLNLESIITENLFTASDESRKAYSYRRMIAYLHDTRHIDKDIMLNFIKQSFLMMDKNYNLCFVAYADPFHKKDVIAISKKGTTEKRFCPNYVKEHGEGFFYAQKEFLETQNYRELYIFESPIDLMSFLSLEKKGQIYIPEHDRNACYISLNGASNHSFIGNVLERYPSIKEINLCLDNDSYGREAAKTIENTVLYRCTVNDFCTMLQKASADCGKYLKDYNDWLVYGGNMRIEE